MNARWRIAATTGLLCAGVLMAGQAFAQEEPAPSRVKVDVGVGTWITTGDTRWSHNASSDARFSNPTSRLVYTDHTANLVDLMAKVSIGPRWFGRVNLGFGDINGGRLTDEDFLALDGGNPSSLTHSDIRNSGTFYVNLEGGARLINFSNGGGSLDGVAGFQYWHEEHQAYGVRQVSCSTAGSTIDLGSGRPLCPAAFVGNSTVAVTNISSWYSIRTGLQTDYRVNRWLSMQGAVILKPLSVFENQDTHHLRRDEFQDPSFTMYGIGIGADADAGLTVHLTKALSLNAGYRVFWNRMLNGTWKNHLADGSSYTVPMHQFQSIRHGAMFGLTASF